MNYRNLCLWVPCIAAALGVAFGQPVTLLPGAASSSGQITFYKVDPFGPGATIGNAAPGAFQIVPKPDGSKYYILSNTRSKPLGVVDANFSNYQTIGANDITYPPTSAVVTPDGTKLLVGVSQYLVVFDTATDRFVTSYYLGAAGAFTDVAVSLDSKTAYILASQGSQSTLFAFDLTTYSATKTLPLPASATGVAVGPNGLVYVSMSSRIWEINPVTLQKTPAGEIAVTGLPGKLAFTSDGLQAIAVNRTPSTGVSLWVFDLGTKSIFGTFPNFQSGVVLNNIYVAGPNRIFVTSDQTTTLYDLAIQGGVNLNPSSLSSVVPINTIGGAALSNESPARNLYLITTVNGQRSLVKIDLVNNVQVGISPITADPFVLQNPQVNPTTGAANVTAFNTAQNFVSGVQTLPLVAKVTDALGRGVIGARVDYATSVAGVNLSAASAFTNADGYALVYANPTSSAPAGAANITGTVAGLAPVTYTITIPAAGSGGGGSGGGGGTGGNGMSIVSGNGQIVSEAFIATQPLLVKVTDASGKPVSGQTVKFAITQGRGTLYGGSTTFTTATDAQGQAQVSFLATLVQSGQSYEQQIVTASSNSGTVNFYLTTVPYQSGGSFVSPPVAYMIKPDFSTNPTRTLTAPAGSTITEAVVVEVVAAAGPAQGQPIPNVGLNVTPAGDPATTPSGVCVGGIPLTDNKGFATCNLVLNNIQGTGSMKVNVGGLRDLTPITVVITPGAPAQIQINGGNNSSGPPGQTIALSVKVTNGSNAPSASQTVTWQIVSGSATVNPTTSSTDSNGVATTTATLGSTTGAVQVKATVGSNSVTFSLSVTAAVGSIQAVSGGSQSATTGQAFGAPLVVKVLDSAGNAVSNTSVGFAVQSGTATLSQSSVLTGSNGQAQVTVTAGATAGSIVVVASTGGQSVSFNLTATAPGPAITPSSFTNGASGLAGLSPCSIAVVTGPGLAPGVQGTLVASSFGLGPLPTTFGLPSNGSVGLQVNGIDAPIFWVSRATGNEQIAFQVPCGAQPGQATVAINVNGGTTTVSNVTISPYAPGIFTYIASDKKVYAVLQRVSDGTYITPGNPAHPGDSLRMFVTGLGNTTPVGGTNELGLPGQMITAPVVVGVNNLGVPVGPVQALEGAIGVYSVQFDVPKDAQPGPYQNLGFAVVGADNNPVFAYGSFLPVQ